MTRKCFTDRDLALNICLLAFVHAFYFSYIAGIQFLLVISATDFPCIYDCTLNDISVHFELTMYTYFGLDVQPLNI